MNLENRIKIKQGSVSEILDYTYPLTLEEVEELKKIAGNRQLPHLLNAEVYQIHP